MAKKAKTAKGSKRLSRAGTAILSHSGRAKMHSGRAKQLAASAAMSARAPKKTAVRMALMHHGNGQLKLRYATKAEVLSAAAESMIELAHTYELLAK